MEASAKTEEPVDARVRRRLRELRAKGGMTLQRVAEASNIDISTLSRLEAGKRRLALDHIPALAAALGVSSDELLRSSPPRDPRVSSRPWTRDGMTIWPLNHRGSGAGPRAYKFEINAKRRTPPDVLPVHEGVVDWLYVLRGPLRLLLGDQDLRIEAGEAVEFSTWTPHWFGAVDRPVELLMIIDPQGERVHFEPDHG